MNYRKLSGIFFILFIVSVQIPFGILGATFNYPDILRESPGKVLIEFQKGGNQLILTWYLYAISILMFGVSILLFDKAENADSKIGSITRIGFISALVQLIALLRWTFLVPELSESYSKANSPEAKEVLEFIFSIQNTYLGVGLGEHLGQITMVIWTFLMIQFLTTNKFLNILGLLSILLLGIGLVEHLSVVFKFTVAYIGLPTPIGFIIWSVWMLGIGIHLIRTKAA
ncbi:MAG: DUF4386 domain-containing protein [Leptospiraceae bacterium]|nr:DUF4386 domain-containing protein [Leptospiraceae bacterium]